MKKIYKNLKKEHKKKFKNYQTRKILEKNRIKILERKI